jgi:hypothetical protein
MIFRTKTLKRCKDSLRFGKKYFCNEKLIFNLRFGFHLGEFYEYLTASLGKNNKLSNDFKKFPPVQN